MKLEKEQLTEMIISTVKPLLVEYGKSMEEVRAEVDDKIKEKLSDISTKFENKAISIIQDEADKDPKAGFLSLSHFAADVYRATKAGFRELPPVLKAWEVKYKSIEKASDQTSLRTDEDQYGAFLIPDEFRNQLWLAVEQKNMILPLTTGVPITGNTIKIPYVNGFDESGNLVYGGIRWYWLDELATKTPTRPSLGNVRLELKKIAGLAYASDEILEDSIISMQNILQNGFRDGLNFNLNNVLIRGTGAGQPLGVLNAPCTVSVAKETGQAASTIVWENILKMYSRVYESANVVWIANENTLPQLATMALSVGTGGVPVWLPPGGASGKPYDTLMGKPLFWNKHCSNLGTVGDIILADWSQYLVGQKAGQAATGKFDTSIHLKFDSDQTAFRFVFRIDGQPWWPAALTPPQATTATLSPFITLATRG